MRKNNELRQFVQQLMPQLDADESRLARAIYRRLADQEAVSPPELAEQTGLAAATVERILSAWPAVYRDQAGKVIGFWGLTAQPVSKHVLRIGGQVRYAWCAWDCLFIPELLGQTVQVISVCPQTGGRVELTVSPHAVERVQPDSAVLSILAPDVEMARQDVISEFCHFVYFFRDSEAARIWVAAHPGTRIISVGEGLELGCVKNAWQFGGTAEERRLPDQVR